MYVSKSYLCRRPLREILPLINDPLDVRAHFDLAQDDRAHARQNGED